MLPYIWNFTSTQEDGYFGQDSKIYNRIDELLSTSSLSAFKAFGDVSKWTYSGTDQLLKGTAVRLVNKTINGNNHL